jgi:sensor histidine kinase YesM
MESYEHIFNNPRFRIAWHLLYWLIVLVYYTLYFGHQGGYYWFTFQFVIYLMPVAIGTTYFFNYYLIPKFLFKKRIFYFILFSIYTIIASFYLISLIIFPYLIINTDEINFVTLDKSLLDIYFLIAGMYTAILMAVLIKLLKLSYERQHLNLKLLEDKTSAELEMLKSQINPHFLFNTLNNIYTLALKKSDQTPEVVLKLSEMLDYLLYECNALKVPLKKEIQLIENYNYLQKIRFGHRLNIQFEKEGNIENCKLAPMLLLPFIENSYKHGAGKERNASWIKMAITVNGQNIYFNILNNKAFNTNPKNANSSGGIGLNNVKKRLDLIYPERHELKISENQDTYSVNLLINTRL